MKHSLVILAALLLAPLTAMHAADAPQPVKPNNAGPVVMATVLWTSRDKSRGLDAQLAALQVAKGRLLVRTNPAGESTSDFEFRFSWRSSKDAKDSNAAPAMVAPDVEPARKAILAAMTDSYPQEVMARVAVEASANGAKKCWEVIFPSPHTGVSLARQFRVARRLVAGRLADMNMMKPLAGTWPPEFHPAKTLALYDAEGVGYSGSTLFERAVNETTLDAYTLAVCGEDIREGILDGCIGVIFPGGTGRGIAEALRPDGVQRVRDFVAKGGGYFGSCAGAYFASAGRPEYTGMIPLKHGQPWEKGKGKLKMGLTPEGAALLGEEFLHIETFYNCGPTFSDLAPNGKPAPVTVLAKFESPATDAKGGVREEMVGTPAILSMPWQKGRIMIISPHPESNPKFYPLVARAIGWTIGQDPNSVQARTPDAIRVARFPDNPIIRPEMLPGRDGENINGPSLIRVPAWLPKPLGKYYLYFAHHDGKYIRLAYADRLEGPWKIYEPGTLHLEEAPGCQGHIASPEAVVDDERKEIRLYFHGPAKAGGGQKTFVAVSGDGLHFKASDEVLGIFYWRVFRWDGWWYAMAKGGLLYRSRDGLTKFEEGPNPFSGSELRGKEYNTPGVRHVALHLSGNRLWVYYSNIGDAPERIFRCHLELTGDWKAWKTSEPQEVLRPETEWEGAGRPLKKSAAGAVKGAENALRDPAIFVEDGRVYLLYSVAGEQGIAIAECKNATTATKPAKATP